jgi:hypothetical protein
MKKTLLLLNISLFFIGVSAALAQVPSYVPTNGLVGWWPFNGNANDESGNGNNGTVNGATLTTDRFGVANKAYSFNGNNFIAVPHNNSFNMPQATWNVWVKKNSASSGNGMYIFGKRDNAQHHITFNEYLGNANGSIGWASGQASGVGGFSIVGGWHMLTIVYNQSISSNNFVYYFDGIQTGTTTVNPFTFLNGDVRFGIEVNNSYWQGFNGFIDDALVYNRILSSCEILDLYNAQLNSFTTNAGSDLTKTCIANPNGAVIGTTSITGQTYSWTPSTGLSSANVSNPTANPTTTTTYTLTTTNSSGCTASDQVIVTVNNTLPVAYAGTDFTKTCTTNPTGLAIGMVSVPGITYSWSPSIGLTNNTISNPVANPSASSTYTVTATNPTNGCTSSDQILINVEVTAPIVSAGNDQTVCSGTAITLSGIGANSYSWNNGITNGVAFTASSTATYTITGTNTSTGCTNTDQVMVTVNPLPAVNAGVDQSVCEYSQVTLNATGANTYTWDYGNQNGVPFTIYSCGGIGCNQTYSVTGTDINGCQNTDEVTVSVNTLPNVNAGSNQTICFGTPIILSASGASTYSWTNNVLNGVPFSPASTATYLVTGTDANGCINTDQVAVTVNPLPTVNAGIDVNVCTGNSTTLNGSGASTYAWNNNVSNAVAFIPTTSGTYSVAGTDANGCTNTDQVVVTVNPLPTISAGSDQSVCTGTAVTLSASGANTYAWDNNVTDGIAFTPASSGTYSVTGTDGNGCINTDQVVVTVNPLPTINAGSDQSVCTGTAVTLSASGANTYVWDNNVMDGIAFTPTTSGTYSVTGTVANGCTNTDQVAVTVNPLPSVNAGADQSICKGAAVTLSGTGATTYAWNNNVTNGVAFNPIATATYSVSGTDANGCTNADEVIVTVNEASASTLTESAMDSYTLNGQTYTQSGTYTQTLTNAAGCDSTITLNLTLSFTGLGELAQAIRIFPNPANDILNIESTSPLIGEYTMYDAAGRVILHGTFTGMTTSIDVRNIAPGTYTLQAKELLERVVVLRR